MGVSIRLTGAALALGIVLAFGAGCSKEDSDFQAAQTADTIEAYESYLKQYPETTNQVTVKERLDQLYFDKAQADKTEEAYQAYLTSYPEGRHANEAKGELEKLMYKRISKDGDRASVEAFLKQYPNGNYTQKAQARFDELSYADKMSASDVKVTKATITAPDGTMKEGWQITGTVTNGGDRAISRLAIKAGPKGGTLVEAGPVELAPGGTTTFDIKVTEAPADWDQTTVTVDYGLELAAVGAAPAEPAPQ